MRLSGKARGRANPLGLANPSNAAGIPKLFMRGPLAGTSQGTVYTATGPAKGSRIWSPGAGSGGRSGRPA